MSYSIDAITDNCYKGTTCLINKLDIRDEKQLDVVESQITVAKISILQHNPIDGNFDFEHYKAIHKFIFEDLYDWAGIPRTVDISKKGTLFVAAKNIAEIATACFERLKNQDYFKNLDLDNFVEKITDFYCVTNNLHPFREGNGRTQRVFLSQLALNAGYEMDFANMDTDELMVATIQAANGVDAYLKNLLREIINPIEPDFDMSMQL
ncbi:MAG: Fic family protein [Clostridia bacterium]|nr:Fic family protein [Clostridia bacterium]